MRDLPFNPVMAECRVVYVPMYVAAGQRPDLCEIDY